MFHSFNTLKKCQREPRCRNALTLRFEPRIYGRGGTMRTSDLLRLHTRCAMRRGCAHCADRGFPSSIHEVPAEFDTGMGKTQIFSFSEKGFLIVDLKRRQSDCESGELDRRNAHAVIDGRMCQLPTAMHVCGGNGRTCCLDVFIFRIVITSMGNKRTSETANKKLK